MGDQIEVGQREIRHLGLRNGRSVRVRPVGPGDAEVIQAFVRRLSETSRRRRFFTPIRELAPAMLAYITGSNGRCGRGWLAEAHESETWCMVARAQRALGEDDGCELALVVADAWQRLGLGHALMEMLIQSAHEACYLRTVADVLRDNAAMLALGRAYDFVVAPSPHGATMFRLVRSPRPSANPWGLVFRRNTPRAGLAAAFAAS